MQDPLEVWLGGRGPKALDRVGRIADGWLGAQLTPPETEVARRRIQEAADRAGREVDPEHFGLSIPLRPRRAARRGAARRWRRAGADIDPRELVPVGAAGLRAFLDGCIEAGLSKFVVRPAGPVASWAEEDGVAGSDAILDLQT